MAALVAGDVTYTLQSKAIGEGGNREFVFSLAFGDSAKTYPAGGVPLTAGSLGCPNAIKSIVILDESNADGLIYKLDLTNKKIRIYKGTAAHNHTLYLANAAVADGATTRINAGTNLIGANTGASLSVAGIAAASGAAGGIVTAAASASDEMATSAAPAATTLYVRVIGW